MATRLDRPGTVDAHVRNASLIQSCLQISMASAAGIHRRVRFFCSGHSVISSVTSMTKHSSEAPAFQPRRVQSLFPGLKLELADVDAGTAHAGFFHGLTRGGFLGGLVRLPAPC